MPVTDPQLLKGVLSLLLLTLLVERESYGYELVVRLRAHGFDALGEGSVYPALSRLESHGWLGSALRASGSGPARKYYRITPAGHEEAARLRLAWGGLTENVARVISEPVGGSA